MHTVIIILLILLLIFIALIFWWYSDYVNNIIKDEPVTPVMPIPTLHAKCGESSSCGGELVCDRSSHRCKQSQGGNCSNDVDCIPGLYCNNWICSDHAGGEAGEAGEVAETITSKGSDNKHIKHNKHTKHTKHNKRNIRWADD
jgi:hypothetical protein